MRTSVSSCFPKQFEFIRNISLFLWYFSSDPFLPSNVDQIPPTRYWSLSENNRIHWYILHSSSSSSFMHQLERHVSWVGKWGGTKLRDRYHMKIMEVESEFIWISVEAHVINIQDTYLGNMFYISGDRKTTCSTWAQVQTPECAGLNVRALQQIE